MIRRYESVRGRKKEHLWMRQDGGWLTILRSIIKYKNTHNDVCIHLMCKGAHVSIEYRHKGVRLILNEHGSGGSTMYPTQVQNTI